jgi:membrane protein
MFFLIKLIYIIAPDGKIKSKYVNVGALFTTVSWLLSTVIFSFYLNHIARFDLVYGNIANIAILLIWLYVISFVFVVGICINKEYVDIGIEKTNNYKFEEIRNRIKQDKRSSNR